MSGVNWGLHGHVRPLQLRRREAKSPIALKTGRLSRIPVLDGFDHGDDIFRRGAGLDVVAGARDIAPTGTEGFQTCDNFLAHIIRRSVRKDVLVLNPSVENHFIAEVPLEG